MSEHLRAFLSLQAVARATSARMTKVHDTASTGPHNASFDKHARGHNGVSELRDPALDFTGSLSKLLNYRLCDVALRATLGRVTLGRVLRPLRVDNSDPLVCHTLAEAIPLIEEPRSDRSSGGQVFSTGGSGDTVSDKTFVLRRRRSRFQKAAARFEVLARSSTQTPSGAPAADSDVT